MLRQARAQRYAASEGPGSRGSSHSHESRPHGQSSYESSSRPLPQLEPFRGMAYIVTAARETNCVCLPRRLIRGGSQPRALDAEP